jgi:hypothetical protein
MKVEQSFVADGDRYAFDFELCHFKKGWAQVDSGQDASYYGNWANPAQRKLVSYCEGDVTIKSADTDEEFVAEVRALVDWMRENTGSGMIDGMCEPEIIGAFERLGLADLLH